MDKPIFYSYLNLILSKVLDFIFPSEEAIKGFEKQSPAVLTSILLKSKAIFDQNGGKMTALFDYSDEKVKYLVWEIKYYRNQKITDKVGFLLAEKIIENYLGNENVRTTGNKTYIVPVPITAHRLRERGYNHTETLARSVVDNLRLMLPPELRDNFVIANNFLKKIRHTPTQCSIENREQRLKNLAGAFEVRKDVKKSLLGENIILIDDVITTGATVQESKKALLSSGAKTVEIFAIAH